MLGINPDTARTHRVEVEDDSCKSFSGLYKVTMAHTCLCAYTFKEKQQKTKYRIWCLALGGHTRKVFWEIWLDGTDHDIAYRKMQMTGQTSIFSITALSHGSLTAKVFRNWKQMKIISTTT